MLTFIVFVLCSFSIFSHPDSVEVTVENHLRDRSIEQVYYTVPYSDTLHTAFLETMITTDSSTTVLVPFGYINDFIFETADKTVYNISGYSASTNSKPISISLANKEFGGLFDRIYGVYPVVIENSTDVNLVDIRILEASLPNTNILRNNVLLPGEFLRVWIDSGKTIQISAVDCEDNISSAITNVTPTTDSLYKFTPNLFYGNGNEFGYDGSPEGSWVVNCITLDEIVRVEAFTSDGSFIDGMDCSSSPLSAWDRIYIRHTVPVGYIVCTDSNNRTYSANSIDSISNSYILGNLNLDFGYDFPD